MNYASAVAFKAALEQRLRNEHPAEIARTRQIVVFSRFLARVVAVFGDDVTLKGGLALELRLEKARTTKDVDLGLRGVRGDRGSVLEKLQEAARLDLGDFLSFRVEIDPDHPDIENDGMKYLGYRFRAYCQLADKEYGSRFFKVDVAMGDPLDGQADQLVTDDWLGFAGVPPPSVRIYRIERHVAEKLHAYTLPRKTPNSRMKDLPDLALLGSVAELELSELRAAIDETYQFRATHEVPRALPEPPHEWRARYARLFRDEALPWADLETVLARAREFVEPALVAQGERRRWDRAAWRWVELGALSSSPPSPPSPPSLPSPPMNLPTMEPDQTVR